MPTISASDARANLYRLIDETSQSHEPVLIIGKPELQNTHQTEPQGKHRASRDICPCHNPMPDHPPTALPANSATARRSPEAHALTPSNQNGRNLDNISTFTEAPWH